MKRLLAIQNYWDDTPGYLGDILQAYDIACEIVKADEAPLPDPGAYDAFFILGGPQSANEVDKYPYLTREKALLRYAVEQDIPYLGICLGGQLLASALGAAVTRHHTSEIGFFQVQLTEAGKHDPLFAGLPGYQQVIQWHEDVFSLPEGAIQLATGEGAPNQAFRFGRRAYGLQYHIELTPGMLDLWFGDDGYRKEIAARVGSETLVRIERDRPSCYPVFRQHSRRLFENFLKISGCL